MGIIHVRIAYSWERRLYNEWMGPARLGIRDCMRLRNNQEFLAAADVIILDFLGGPKGEDEGRLKS